MMTEEKKIHANELVLGAKNLDVEDEDMDSKISQDVDDKLIGDDKELDELLESARPVSDKPGDKKNNY
ncbi:hypothetical protein BH11BAC3_BH11BAC3_09450 [soil metagenome]